MYKTRMTSAQNFPLFGVMLDLASAHRATCMSYGVVDDDYDDDVDGDCGDDDGG